MSQPMKARESGMPEEAMWATFFNADAALEKLIGTDRIEGNLVEFGCGYGTFTIPAAQRTHGIVTALDIETDLLSRVEQKASEMGLTNVRCVLRDFVAHGTGLGSGSQAHAMIFNLLHLEQPVALLREACRVLRKGGRVSVIHWRSDISTPRGPSLAIRPTPERCREWISEAGFEDIESIDLTSCCPYHFGLIATC